jgi:hypothetical protein
VKQSSNPIPDLYFSPLSLVSERNNLSSRFMRSRQRVFGKWEIIHYKKIGMAHSSSVNLEESLVTFGDWDIDCFERIVFPVISAWSERETHWFPELTRRAFIFFGISGLILMGRVVYCAKVR